jgi:hypothetical protein
MDRVPGALTPPRAGQDTVRVGPVEAMDRAPFLPVPKWHHLHCAEKVRRWSPPAAQAARRAERGIVRRPGSSKGSTL